MFTIEAEGLRSILARYGVSERVADVGELLRYHYEKHDPASKEVRLIVKVSFAERGALVLKLKNEADVTADLLEAQCGFSETLAAHGVDTARYYRADGRFAVPYVQGDWAVLATLEDFAAGEVKTVTEEIAERTGETLGRAHNIAEAKGCHVCAPVLFDPFVGNDLFSYEEFSKLALPDEFATLCATIRAGYETRLGRLLPLRERRKYAVQGDVSDCNLFLTPEGRVGLFDFNRSGDAVLFCDAVMQAVFTSRLMDYDRALTAEFEEALFRAFLRGYARARPFAAEEAPLVNDLRAVARAFDLGEMYYAPDSLAHCAQEADWPAVAAHLARIARRLAEA